ncbi:peptidase A24 [Paenibacillus sp. FSL R7-0273]|nr:peptidase A24 [Paenibacillus sp. FSL R7-0273]
MSILAGAFATDLRWMRIPNWISVTALVTGLLLRGIADGGSGLLFALSGAAAGFAALLLMYMMGAVGAGDVKLFAGIGAWTGIWFTLQVIMYSVLFGAVIGWIIVLFRRETAVRIRSIVSRTAGFLLMRKPGLLINGIHGQGLRFPFMLAVIPGFVYTYFCF